jgi:hypothetical protein
MYVYVFYVNCYVCVSSSKIQLRQLDFDKTRCRQHGKTCPVALSWCPNKPNSPIFFFEFYNLFDAVYNFVCRCSKHMFVDLQQRLLLMLKNKLRQCSKAMFVDVHKRFVGCQKRCLSMFKSYVCQFAKSYGCRCLTAIWVDC